MPPTTFLEPIIGQREHRTQHRIVELFRNPPINHGGLGYTYLGDWTENAQSSPINTDRPKTFLSKT